MCFQPMAPSQQTRFLLLSIMHNISLVFSVIKEHVGKTQENQHLNSTESQQLRATMLNSAYEEIGLIGS